MSLLADYTVRNLGADLIVVLFVCGNIWLGFHSGLVRRIIVMAGTYGSVIMAFYTGNAIASVVSTNNLDNNSWTFLAMFALGVVFLEILTFLYADALDHLMVVAFNRLVGSLAGIVLGIFELCVVFIIPLAQAQATPTAANQIPLNHSDLADVIKGGVLSDQIVKLVPGVQSLIQPALSTDWLTHLEQTKTIP